MNAADLVLPVAERHTSLVDEARLGDKYPGRFDSRSMKLSSRSGIGHGAFIAISHDVVIHVDRDRKIVLSCLTPSHILSLEMLSAREKCVCEESLVSDFATGCDLPIVNNRDIASGRNMRHERIPTDCVRKCDNLFLLLTRHKPP